MKARNSYIWLGSGLSFTGVWLVPVAHFLLESTPVTALGLSLIILGTVCLVLGRTRPRISPEVSTLLLETSLENISAIIEELGLTSKGIYLPSSKAQGQSQALIPLHSASSLSGIGRSLPKRLIVKYGPNPEDIGLLVTTPGSATTRMLESVPEFIATELEDALTSILDGMLDMADGVRVSMNGGAITVEVINPRVEYKNIRFYECLGSPVASIAASLAAEASGKPVVVEKETPGKGKSVIELGMLE